MCNYLTRQPHKRWKPAEPRSQHFHPMLINKIPSCFEQTLLRVLFRKGHCAGNSITDVDRFDIMEMHLRREEADHAADVGYHASCEQARDVAPPEKVALRERFIYM